MILGIRKQYGIRKCVYCTFHQYQSPVVRLSMREPEALFATRGKACKSAILDLVANTTPRRRNAETRCCRERRSACDRQIAATIARLPAHSDRAPGTDTAVLRPCADIRVRCAFGPDWLAANGETVVYSQTGRSLAGEPDAQGPDS